MTLTFDRAAYGHRTSPFEGSLSKDFAQDWRQISGLRHIDAALSDDGRHVLERIAPGDIEARLAAGQTICADITTEPSVRLLLDTLCDFLGTPKGGFAKLYVSPNGAGFPLHFDPYHVFVVQCAGEKRWTHGVTPALPNAREPGRMGEHGPVFGGRLDGAPLVGKAGAVEAPTDLAETRLTPGTGLYLPPGTWHRAEAVGTSIAVSLSPPRFTPFALIQEWLEARALVHPEWFADLPLHEAGSARASRTTERRLTDALATMREELNAPAQHWVRRWLAALSVEGEGTRAEIGRSTKLTRVSPLAYIEDDAALVFYGGGQEWSLPLEARPFLEGLARSRAFRSEDALLWDDALRWPAAKELLEALLRGGLLRLAQP